MKSRAHDEVRVRNQIADWKSLIPGDIPALYLVRWLSGRKQRFAKSKTEFYPESPGLTRPLQFQTREAIALNRVSSRVLLRHSISGRRLTFLTYLFAHHRARCLDLEATRLR